MKLRYVLSFALVASFIGLCALLNTQTLKAEEVEPARILVFTRSQGFQHQPAERLDDGTTGTGRILTAYFRAYNKNVEIVETQDGRVFDGDIDQYDAFVFYTSGNLLSADGSKNEHAHPMTEAGLRRMIAAVRGGKGFVGIHAATDSHSGIVEDGGDIFTRFVGARFTGHGPDQYAKLTVVQPTAFPFLKGKGEYFTFFDEWYGMGQFSPDMHVILIQETEGMYGYPNTTHNDYARPPYPMSWIRAEGQGRVAYTSVGHNNQYLTHIIGLVGDLVEWSIGRFDADTTPNIETVTPGFRQMP